MTGWYIVILILMFQFGTPVWGGVISDPYTGTPTQINGTPGASTIFEAENFDKGGEGVAFHDPHNCGANNGAGCSCTQTYRPDGVNVCAIGAINFVSYDDAGLWVNYTIDVASSGAYTVELFVAFNDAGCCAAAAYHVEVDGYAYPSVALGPALTGSWTTFDWRGKTWVALLPGRHVLRIVVDKGWFNFDTIRIRFAAAIEWQQVPVWRNY